MACPRIMSFPALIAIGLLLLLIVSSVPIAGTFEAASAHEGSSNDRESALVHTDGHLRPGHLETLWVRGFPAKGLIEVAFFPTAICESSCGAITRRPGKTRADGSGKFRVRVPGTFINSEGGRTYFRDRERIDLQVLWYGRNKGEVSGGTARPLPVIVRWHRSSQDG